jgi:putative transposase
LPKLRRSIALKLINEYGVSLAETARQLGISTSGVAQILRRSRDV